MQARPNRTISVYAALVLLVCFAVYFYPEDALAVRPFVTDDARIVYKGQLATETYGGMTVVKGYAMAHVSWFLLTPDPDTDPYDNNLAIHLNLGAKSRYDAGPATY
jgi:hypothetical protein